MYCKYSVENTEILPEPLKAPTKKKAAFSAAFFLSNTQNAGFLF